MKTILSALLLLALPGFGQGRDTVFAVHKLFHEKRGGGASWTATGATIVAGAATRPAAAAPQPGGSDAATAAVMGGVPAALGLLQLGRYSAEREAKALKLYAEGWGLPADIRRRLKRRHFRRTSQDVRAGL